MVELDLSRAKQAEQGIARVIGSLFGGESKGKPAAPEKDDGHVKTNADLIAAVGALNASLG